MSSGLCWALVVSALVAFPSPSSSTCAEEPANYSDCATQLLTLERALYETGDNVFELNKVFFPPSKRTSRFIRVNYTFLNETGEDDGCNVTYIWAIGGFLFFQPPSVFELTSLFFNYPNNDLTHVSLKLPSACRPLIEAHDKTTKCSCLRDSERLDILTQQLNVYARYEDLATLVRENTFARAVCSEEIHDIYYDNENSSFNFIILASTIPIPIFVLFLLLSAIRKADDSTLNSFTQPTAHPSLVAYVLTGTVLSIGILTVDILACSLVVNGEHEYSDLVNGHPINLYIVFGVLVCDILFILPLLTCIVYITICFNCRGVIHQCCCKTTCALPPCLEKVVAFAIGRTTFNKVKKLSANGLISFLFPLMLLTPILCVSSHIGYVLLAWLTEPSKATTSFLIYYMVLVYCFFAFRKCYTSHSRFKFSLNLSRRRKQEDKQGRRGTATELISNPQIQTPLSDSVTLSASSGKILEEQRQQQQQQEEEDEGYFGRHDKEHINTQTFALLIVYGLFIVLVPAITILTFVLLPFSSERLVTYVFQLLQLIVVLVSTQIAYTLFFGDSFSLQSIVKKFKEVYAKEGGHPHLKKIAQQKHEDLTDVAGEFAAGLTDVIIHNTSQGSADRSVTVDSGTNTDEAADAKAATDMNSKL